MLWLPENYRQYLVLLVASLLIGAGMVVHVLLNVQIAEERYAVSQLAEQRQRIERENSGLVYAIANSVTLDQIRQSALEQGYRPVTDRVYVRRDEVSTSVVPGMANASQASVSPSAPVAAAVDRSPQDGFIDAVGRGLGAAGAWLQQAAAMMAQATGGFVAGFRERWMP